MSKNILPLSSFLCHPPTNGRKPNQNKKISLFPLFSMFYAHSLFCFYLLSSDFLFSCFPVFNAFSAEGGSHHRHEHLIPASFPFLTVSNMLAAPKPNENKI